MSRIHKVAFYLVDAIGWHDKDGIKSKIADVFGGNDLRQVHVETSEYFVLRNGDSECDINCDLADIEKHFDHAEKSEHYIIDDELMKTLVGWYEYYARHNRTPYDQGKWDMIASVMDTIAKFQHNVK